LVLSVVVLLFLFDFTPKPERTLLREVIFSALMVENWYLAFQSRDYLASDGWLSMVQHYWAVSIQVQLFAGFLALSALLKRVGVEFHSRASALFFIAVSVMSATYAFYITLADPTYAYFDTFARAWQFGSGVLIGFLATQIPGWLRRFHFPYASVGLGLIFLTGVYTPPSHFPFPSGLAPVGGGRYLY
jgi:peptidoglycan/LPS O-acetylase OafA/YrhL